MIGGAGLSFREKLRKWQSNTAEQIRPLNFWQKAEYFFSYYKLWLLGLLIFILFAGYIGDAVIQSHKEILLEGFFTNDEWNVFDASCLEDEYASLYPPEKNQMYLFDDSLYISLDGDATEYTAASKGKIIAYMATRELDFIITTEPVLDFYLDSNAVPMEDFEDILMPDQFSQLRPYLRSGTDSEGVAAFVALDLSKSPLVAENENVLSGNATDTYWMFIPYGAPHREVLIQFIDFLFPADVP